MFNETSYDGGPRGMGAIDWGSLIGGIGNAIGGAFGNPPYYGGNTGNTGNQAQQSIACAQSGGTWHPTLGCIRPGGVPPGGSDVAFQGSTFFWILAGVVAFSLLSKRR